MLCYQCHFMVVGQCRVLRVQVELDDNIGDPACGIRMEHGT